MSYIINAYAVAQFTAATIALCMIGLVWKRRHSRGGTPLFLLFIAVFWWAVSAGFEAAAVSRELKILWSQISYVGAQISPPFFLLLSIEYTNRKFNPTLSRIAPFFFIPVITIVLVFTNETHQLIWSGFDPGPVGTNSMIYHHGGFFWVAMVYIILITTISSLILMAASVKTQALYKRQNRFIILASVFPILGSILYITELNPFPGLDLIPSSFIFTGVILLFGISKEKLMDVVPISHEFIIKNFHDAVIVLDDSKRIIDMNMESEKLLQVHQQEVIGKQASEVIGFWPEIQSGINTQKVSKYEIEQIENDPAHIQVNISPQYSQRKKLIGYVLVVEDISRRKYAEIKLQSVNTQLEQQLDEIQILQKKLHEQAISDPLTGVFNRGYLDSTLTRELARAKRNNYPLTLFMIDVDNFKEINDTFGHKIGDYVIKAIAGMLKEQTRLGDCVCRFGGDEFVIIMPEMKSFDAEKWAEGWRQTMKTMQFDYQGKTLRSTVSIGVVTYPQVGKNANELIDAVDHAMYLAKGAGRDCVRIYSRD